MNKSNVDQQEIHKFNELAASWWDQQGPMRPLHWMTPTRLEYIQRFTSLHLAKVLDVGCGGGIFSQAMAEHSANVIGLDQSEDLIRVAQQHANESSIHQHGASWKLDYRVEAIEEHQSKLPYDIVTCLEVVEHVPHPEQLVLACAKQVKAGGWVFFSTINRTPRAFIEDIVFAEYILRILPRGTHDYAAFLKPAEMAQYARAAGLEVIDVSGMVFKPLQKCFQLRPKPASNYFMACQKNFD